MTLEFAFEEDWSELIGLRTKNLRMFRVLDVSFNKWKLDSLKDFDFTFVVMGLGFCITIGFPEEENIT